MDEVHELSDALQVRYVAASAARARRTDLELRGSVNTAPSPVKRHLDSSSSDGSESSSSEEEEDRSGTRNGGGFGSGTRARGESSDEDSDEPPEIPGIGPADFGAFPVSTIFLPDKSDARATGNFGAEDEDEYEVKEVEQPRAAEFHASSSSEDEEDSDDELKTQKFQLQMERSALGRPKTAAKDLEKYRDVVPSDFFQQFEGATTLNAAISPSSRFANTPTTRPDRTSSSNTLILSTGHDETNKRKYKVDIPRPDGKEDTIGVDVLREPSGQTNVAELELLMQVSMTNQNKLRSRSEVVRSVEWAAQRPQEIEQWIASVEKVQRTKPLAQVNYKQYMPALSQLMELWPEEFEDFLSARGDVIPPLAELDVNLKELVRIVCAMLDIPVYEGNYVQSLHVLFSFYLEIENYERDAQRQKGSQR
ncbi:unnamed protein product [Phytophthora lilii]|uniref:Unnamed protein product n=1 Tax=Phytophthora lilii TaxID=2077276 RepID=A0A9W6TK98_9STRA|nr:unnamed protein product [Phytophthora lilii]